MPEPAASAHDDAQARPRKWSSENLPEHVRTLVVILAMILALAAATAPIFFLLRRLGVG